MSNLSEKDVEHVAHLARLNLTKEEIKKFQKELSPVVSYFEELSEVDTSIIEPTSQTTGLINVLGKDQIDSTNILPVDLAIREAKEVSNDFVKVPRILDK